MDTNSVNESSGGQMQAGAVKPIENQLADLQSAVDAGKQVLGQSSASQLATEAPLTQPSPTDDFKSVFGSGEPIQVAQPVSEATAPSVVPDVVGSSDMSVAVSETPSSSALEPAVDSQPVAQLDPSINTVADLLSTEPQAIDNSSPAAEAVAPTEQTPQEKLKQKISADIDAFLEEITAGKVTSS